MTCHPTNFQTQAQPVQIVGKALSVTGKKDIVRAQKQCTVESPGEYNGVTLTDRTKILERWKEHFETVLNQSSSFDMNVLSEIPQWPLASRLEEVPTRAEIQKAINQMSNGKAPGTDGIPAEVFKKCSSCLLLHLVDLF